MYESKIGDIDPESHGFCDYEVRYSAILDFAQRNGRGDVARRIKENSVRVRDISALIKIAKSTGEKNLVSWLRNLNVNL